MAVQTSYAVDHDPAYAGMLADLQLSNRISKINKDVVNIEYGKAVVTSGEDGAILPLAGSVAAEFAGVAMRELNRAYAPADDFGAEVNNLMTVVTFGPIWVKAAVTVVKDEPVFFRVGATQLGDFSNAAGSSATLSVAIPGAKFLTGGDAGELVKISLGLGG